MNIKLKTTLTITFLSLLLQNKICGALEDECGDKTIRLQTLLTTEKITITEVIDPRRPGNLIAPPGYSTLLGEGLLVILPEMICKQYADSGLTLRKFLERQCGYKVGIK